MSLDEIAVFEIFKQPDDISRIVFKYVLMTVVDSARQSRYIIRAGEDSKNLNHVQILNYTRTSLGPDFTVNHHGGGYIQINPKIRTIILSGESSALRVADKKLVEKILADIPAFAGFEFDIL